ncbi:cytochrome b, partial [Shewanella sp. 0m-11]
TPFYAILRAIPDKLMGVIGMGLAIAVLFILPWLDRCSVKSIRYRSMAHKLNISQFAVSFVVLGYLGAVPATPALTIAARIFTVTYFGFFLLLWIYSKNEKTKPVPERLTH